MQAFAGQGLRVLATAIIRDGGELNKLRKEDAADKLSDFSLYNRFESGGTFLGIMCIKDPTRPEVKPAIIDCKTAGIRVIMITGDSKETALSIAKELEIIDPTKDTSADCFTGLEFEALSVADKKKALSGHGGKVFSRVEPRHKRELVKQLIDMVSSSSS